ncbi:MAG TPA: DegT/DnrJ/EryC1/StrS family aminotransferase [Planctomycetaceae bacterium]|nr:DegT/DnrJ/EryC1/StrS family aminotransferase [Planctomycetaceae bacterium]
MVKAFDYLRSYEQIEPEIRAAIDRVLRSGQLILGPEVAAFEREFAATVGAVEAVGVASGTDALELALLAVGVGRDDEVITVANTAVPTAAAIRAVGAVPRFVDVDPDTLLMSPSLVAAAITPRTRCLLPVHLHGLSAEMPALLDIARRHDLRVIEDCAHAHGASHKGRHVGTFGDVGCFSFYPTKNLGAYGDGGMCVTNNVRLAERLRSLRMYGFDANRIAQTDGRNSRLDEVQAAILRVKLTHLPAALAARQDIAGAYRRGLSGLPCRLPAAHDDAVHACHQFVIRCPNRGGVMAACDARGVGYGIHYETPLHHMPAYRGAHEGRPPLPVTDAAATEILSLPIYPELRADEIEQVIAAVRAGLSGEGR